MEANTTEEEFLYQLNLSKCETPSSVSSHSKKRVNTRSRSKLSKVSSYNYKSLFKTNPENSFHTERNAKSIRFDAKISHLKAANLKDQTKKTPKFLKPAFIDCGYSNGEGLLLDIHNEDGNNVTGFCRICRRAYSSKSDRVEHFKSTDHIVIVEAKKGTDYEALKEESDVFKGMKFPSKCSVCGEGPFRRRDFLAHHRRHVDVQPYHCIRCKKKYRRRCDLLTHIRSHIEVNRRFKCPKCSCLFVKRSSIVGHLIAKHQLTDTRPRKYKCTECGRGFLTKQDVDRHMQIHTGHISLRCTTCGKGCSTMIALLSHQRIHSGETPFKCDQCPYVCKGKQALLRHQRKHNGEKPFKCQLCSFTCSQSAGIKRHMAKHTGTKPYKCPYCDYRSSNIENLRKHVKKTRKHSGLNVYPCQHCDFSTDVGSEFLKHLKERHFPHLDEVNSSATKLSGILVSQDDQQPQDVDDEQASIFTTNSDQSTHCPPEEAPSIEMVIVGDPNSSPHSTASSSHVTNLLTQAGVDKLRPEVVTALDEIFLNALIKIPNLQQVILPPSGENSPVTLVIGSDYNPHEMNQDDTPPSTTTQVNFPSSAK